MRNRTNSGWRVSMDDTLFVIALALPILVAAARYFESDREMTALARAQEARPTLIAKARTTETARVVQDPIASHWQSGTAQNSNTTLSTN